MSKIILSLASKQVWPQILTVLHEKPEKLVLLHSEDSGESRLPAQHLKKFFEEDTRLMGKGSVALEKIPSDSFSGVESALDDVVHKHGVDLREVSLNFTGGNKLMSNAAFRWTNRRGVPSFYLERNNQIAKFRLTPEGELVTLPMEKLDGHLADGIDPISLLRCQLEASVVERPGELLALKEGDDAERLLKMAGNGNPMKEHLEIQGKADPDLKEGDALEYQVAAILLALGVKQVRRSLRLKAKDGNGISSRLPHAELDLVFSWGGKLWMVDCKDRKPVEDLANLITADSREIVERIRKELMTSHAKVLKEDLVAMREMGGLMGRIVCVRKSELPEEVQQFARHQKIEIVRKTDLRERFDALLHPDKKAGAAELESLAGAFGKK